MDGTIITMIDYGASNIRSAQKAFEAVGASVELTSDPDVVLRAEKLVLPGVGAFGAGMQALCERGLDTAVNKAVANGIPLLQGQVPQRSGDLASIFDLGDAG